MIVGLLSVKQKTLKTQKAFGRLNYDMQPALKKYGMYSLPYEAISNFAHH